MGFRPLRLGGAAVAIAGGVIMGIEAGRASSARAEKDYSKAISDYNSTKTPYYVGLASVLAGGTSAAAGLVLLVMRSDSSHATGLRIVPWLG